MEEELFARIISMCLIRILQRLYLILGKRKLRKPKKPIKLDLQNVVEYVKEIFLLQIAMYPYLAPLCCIQWLLENLYNDLRPTL